MPTEPSQTTRPNRRRSPRRTPTTDDGYLLALAIARRAFLVTGDQHLLGLRDDLPILTPAEFMAEIHRAN